MAGIESWLISYLDSLCCDLQVAFTREGLSRLWNELVKDGEIVTCAADGLFNSAGLLAKKGESKYWLKKGIPQR